MAVHSNLPGSFQCTVTGPLGLALTDGGRQWEKPLDLQTLTAVMREKPKTINKVGLAPVQLTASVLLWESNLQPAKSS